MDTQAINGYNGPGPYTIVNNYLEAAGENFMLGGASPNPQPDPRRHRVHGHHLYKPLAWRTPIVPTPTGVTAVAGRQRLAPGGDLRLSRAGGAPDGAGRVGLLRARRRGHGGVGAGGHVTVSWAPVPGATPIT